MQEEGSAGVEEDARQDRYPGKGDEVDGQSEPQGETGEGDDDKHLQGKEQDGRCGAQVGAAEDVEVDHEEAEEKEDEQGLTEDGEGALFVAERLIVVGSTEGLEDLIGPLGDYVTVVDDLLSFLNESHGRREGSEQFGTHVLCSCRIEHEVDGAVVAVPFVRGHGCI